jgi:undecaprenyl-diphosphatase
MCLASAATKQGAPSVDIVTLRWIHHFSTPLYDRLFVALTTLGNIEVLTPLVVLLVAYMGYRKWRMQAAILFFGYFGAGALDFVLKHSFHRVRPALWSWLITETGYSFPSGHAVLSSAVAFSIVAIAWNTRWRWLAVVTGVSFMLLMGLSRLYLGVHYPTDIIAGWCVSLVWVSICWAVITNKKFLS